MQNVEADIESHAKPRKRFRPYSEYCQSGVRWLGSVPRHWNIQRLKHLASLRPSNVNKKSEVDEHPIRLCNYVDVYHRDYITADVPFMEATATADEIRRFWLQQDDILITKDSEEWNDIAVPAYVDEPLDGVVCGYHLALVRPFTAHAHGEYLFRGFAAHAIRDQFRIAANGITRFGLSRYEIASAFFPVPPIEEQKSIARFLRRETARIDALVAKKKQLIELLQEKRAALISHAVTGNLLIPDKGFWRTMQLGRAIKLQRGFDITGASDSGGTIPVISSGGFSGSCETPIVKGPGVVVGRKGTVGTVYYVETDFWPHDTTLWVKEFRGNYPRFVYYFLVHMKLDRFDVGAANPTVNRNHVHPVTVSWPDVATQKSIARLLDDQIKSFAVLSNQVSDAITKLQEYRCALVSAAVSGKIDVRAEPRGGEP